MSTEIYVFFHGKLPSKAAVARCFRELEFPLSFCPGTGPLDQQEGFLPMRLRGEESGVECNVVDDRARVERIAGSAVDPSFARGAGFRWSSSAAEGMVATCFSAAVAKLAEGVVFDPQAGAVLTAEQAIASAREWLEATQVAARLPGARPADIRRSIRPLLRQRPDLVLAGRFLLIPPIRHIVRAAYFKSRGDRFRFQVSWICIPLYDDREQVFDEVINGPFDVWQPHFQPLLISTLADCVFDKIGAVTTLSEFALLRSSIASGGGFREVTALVLAGDHERAAAVVAQHKNTQSAVRIERHFHNLMRDIETTCARFHAREAETVREYKLERFWVPSPFPVELPPAERASRCSESRFVTQPWPAVPPGLRVDMPLHPGEVRYAKDFARVRDELKLIIPLTPAEAEERHRALEDYVAVRREPDGKLLRISHSTGWDRNAPEARPPGLTRPRYYVSLDVGADRILAMTSSTGFDEPGLIQIFSIDISRESRRVWLGYFDLRDGRREVFDWRSGDQIVSRCSLTDAERRLCTVPTPGFGEYDVLIERTRALLRAAGYGERS